LNEDESEEEDDAKYGRCCKRCEFRFPDYLWPLFWLLYYMFCCCLFKRRSDEKGKRSFLISFKKTLKKVTLSMAD
jgi:hypothetical protein